MRKIIILFFILNGIINSQERLPEGSIQIHSDKIQWQEAPPSMPKGSEIFIMEGNPKSEGIFTMRVKIPPGIKLDMHTHPKDERVTLLEGEIYIGFSKDIEPIKFTAGDFYINPKGTEHFVLTKDQGAIIQITGEGPWEINYTKQ